jgi:cyanophycinase-like exopeptidase
MDTQIFPEPGLIILFGSGETSPTGRKIFERVFRLLPSSPRLALLETPAGFELNSPQVIGRVGDFFSHRLQNFSPQVEIIAARKRGTSFSPDDPQIVNPLLNADMIFMGPGSPSYAIRQLRDSLAWYYLVARHRLGAALALASAATIAFSACALPVYEIYKVGEDLHWNEGLNFFRLYGMELVFIPHWNNNEGGAELDTSRCFMGQERFTRLMSMLPEEVTIIGLDEKTALIMNPSKCECYVSGLGNVTLVHTGHKHSHADSLYSLTKYVDLSIPDNNLFQIAEQRGGHVHIYKDRQSFPMGEIGPFHPYHPEANLPYSIWQKAVQANYPVKHETPDSPSDEVMHLIRARDEARLKGNWTEADEIRIRIEELGWEVSDTEDGPSVKKIQP